MITYHDPFIELTYPVLVSRLQCEWYMEGIRIIDPHNTPCCSPQIMRHTELHGHLTARFSATRIQSLKDGRSPWHTPALLGSSKQQYKFTEYKPLLPYSTNLSKHPAGYLYSYYLTKGKVHGHDCSVGSSSYTFMSLELFDRS